MGGYGQEALKTLLKRFTSSKTAVLRSSTGNELIDKDFFKGKAGAILFLFLYPKKICFFTPVEDVCCREEVQTLCTKPLYFSPAKDQTTQITPL